MVKPAESRAEKRTVSEGPPMGTTAPVLASNVMVAMVLVEAGNGAVPLTRAAKAGMLSDARKARSMFEPETESPLPMGKVRRIPPMSFIKAMSTYSFPIPG